MANQASANQAKAQAWGSAISGVAGAATSLIGAPEGTVDFKLNT
jgi:nicotinamide mononucleotide (NMN) deamidase PncC